LKPENVVYFREHYSPTWKLIDFGSACYFGEVVLSGTQEFCAPEVLIENAPIATPATDIFSVGRILHWLSAKNQKFFDRLIENRTKPQELVSLVDEEHEVIEANIGNAAIRKLVRSLINKEPTMRITVWKALKSIGIQFQLRTTENVRN